ncbi:MAG: DEAD/DEAH box helicase [Opitutaceae bacterium]|jgi:superfamily II DNA or RNA helicase|nr:DEAD/DEAH box helicase [Opitutaceae bacterium]
MQNHGPKRVYTPHSLEFWFSRLEHNWESSFTAEQLERGHAIYREGEVRELELTDTDAIVHRRIDKKDEYAVIEWAEKGFTVRSSSTDLDAAKALAVAGLHEIEELVADEISPLPEDAAPAPAASAQVAQASHASAHAPAAASASGHAPAPAKTAASVAGAASKPVASASAASAVVTATAAGTGAASASAAKGARTLLLSFATTDEGLTFAAVWLATDKSRAPALGPASREPGLPVVSSGERAKLIGLASYARKAHFVYRQESGTYLMGSVAEIPNFLKTTLPAWKRVFGVELDAASALLLRGPQEITIEAAAATTRRGAKGAGLEAALDLRWIFKAGERLLTEAEVKILTTKNTTPVILPSVGIVSLPVEKLAVVKAWEKGAAETHGEGAMSPYLIFSLFSDARFKLSLSPELAAWRDGVLGGPAAKPALPERLRSYQRRGVEWMWHLADRGCHGLLADEMGLGKTLQVITLMAMRRLDDLPSLIVCPASVVPVWREEIAKFHPELQVDVLKTGHDFSSRAAPCVWLSSYTQLRKHRAILAKHKFAYAVLDEGQFIKNPDAKVTQTCFAIRAAHRIVLSGTPLENRQLDLWSIFRYLLPGLLGSRASFENAIAADRAGTLARLRAQLAPFMLRRTKAEVASELPPKQEMELICPLTDVQRAEYARICNEGLSRLGDDVGAAMREKSFGFLALLTRLRQVCCDPDMLPWRKSPLADSGKIALLVEKLAEIVGSGHKVVIFSQFVMLLDRVKEALAQNFPDLPRHELTGMTLDRQKPVQSFQTAEGAAVMLVSLKAAGTGITLHAADYVFLLDPWWNPAVEAQAVDRVHRLGQTSTVFVYRMVTAGTIEERIEALKASKKNLFNQVVGGLDGDFDIAQHFVSLRDLVQLTGSETSSEAAEADALPESAAEAPAETPAKAE